MDQEVMAHIFDPFFSTKPVGLGTGLGLAICWSIVKAHNGAIKATSNVSQGSEISIVLPIKKAESSE
jgi:signal transduction histidine kinase